MAAWALLDIFLSTAVDIFTNYVDRAVILTKK